MRLQFPSTRFRRDVKLAKKRGLPLDKLEAIMSDLILGRPLSPLRRDHALSGDLHGCRDCHVDGDWILIYRIDPLPAGDRTPDGPAESVIFLRTGTHSDIFD